MCVYYHLFQLGHNLLRILIIELSVLHRVLDAIKFFKAIFDILIRVLAQCCELLTILIIGRAELTL